jgi:prepilin signal peptidase PulO-like enzyme (type II secretory pathway)
MRGIEFLPVSREEMHDRGWYYYDFLVVTADAYIDHPSFGTTLIARALEADGFRVAILAQPEWKDCQDFVAMGKPRYGVLIGGGFLYAIAFLYLVFRKEEGMGGGDIKLLAWIGAVLGWTSIPFVILVSSILGSLVGLGLAVRHKAGLKSVIPFGPYLALAALMFILGGEAIGLWYIGLFLPDATPVH